MSIGDAVTTLCFQEHLDKSSYYSRLSSGSDAVKSEQSEDEGYDGSGTTGFEEWHGFQDTAIDRTSSIGAFRSGPSSVSRPGTPKPPSRHIVLDQVT